MPEAGYVYVLLNASMEGLAKVGRTTRDPRDRAQELSLATGVPTPFFLAFFRFFSDCQQGEQYVHALLERRGYRVSANREFFNAPLNEVVDAILQARDVLSGHILQQSSVHDEDADLVSAAHSDDFLDTLDLPSSTPGEDLMNEADAYYYGLGETLQDYSEAMRLYKQAARLGAVQAYYCVGKMYAAGEGCIEDTQKALEFFKEGARKGDVSCYAEMAELFIAKGHRENARKCWDRFFTGGGVNSESVLIGYYCYNYFNAVRRYSWPLDHLDALRQVKDKLQTAAEETLKYAKEHGGFVALCEERLNEILRRV